MGIIYVSGGSGNLMVETDECRLRNGDVAFPPLCCNRRHRAGLVLVARRQRASGIDRYARWLHPWVDENLSGRVAEDEVLAFYESCTARGGLVRSSEPPGGRDAYVFFKHEETPAGAVYAEELIRTVATID